MESISGVRGVDCFPHWQWVEEIICCNFWSLAFPFFGCALSRPPRLQTWLWENSEWERQAEKSTHQQDKSFGLFRKCGKSVLAQGACPRQGGRDEGLSIAGVAE
jgi:hypothetical protein